jgi:hypothetical protein
MVGPGLEGPGSGPPGSAAQATRPDEVNSFGGSLLDEFLSELR